MNRWQKLILALAVVSCSSNAFVLCRNIAMQHTINQKQQELNSYQMRINSAQQILNDSLLRRTRPIPPRPIQPDFEKGLEAMPNTELRRLFYNKAVDQFTIRENNSTNPIGQLQTMNVGRPVFAPEDFGAKINVPDITVEQAAANRSAIQKLIDQMPDSGGAMVVTGNLQYLGPPIANPRRVFGQVTDPRPIPFEIIGATRDAALTNLGPSPAIAITGGYSFQVPSTVARTRINGITVYSNGTGIQIRGGGKEVQISNVVIADCAGVGLDVDGFDGGILEAYCINNKSDGARISNAHLCDIKLRSRGNLGAGLVVRSCNSWRLWADLEANAGYGLDAEDFKLVDAVMWQEQNNGSKTGQYTLQGRLRRSQLNITGIVAQDRGLAFDMDGLSRLATRFTGRIERGLLTPYRLDLPWPAPTVSIRPGLHAIVAYGANDASIDLIARASAYSDQPANISSNWIELYGQGWFPALTKREIFAGDTIVHRVRFKADSAAAIFFRSLAKVGLDVPALKVNLSHAALADGQQMYISDTNEFELEVVATAIKHAVDDLRAFMYVCPVKLPVFQDGTGEPPYPHTITVTGCDFFHIPA